MRIRVPPKRVRERFLLIYELEGCKKAVEFLTKYYGVRPMRIVLNGRKVGRKYAACYLQNRAYFTRKGLNKRLVLHELYHHLVYVRGLGMLSRKEEIAANGFARAF
jgi:hypothetical protein